MSWSLEYTAAARRDLGRLDQQAARRVLAALGQLAQTNRGDVKRLKGVAAEWRLRVGHWRVRFEYDTDARTIRVLRVLPRGRAYRD